MTQIKGQITISEYLTPKDVDIMGLCDDAYCPECHYCFNEITEKDCEFCPVCHTRVNWARWHRINDEEDVCTDYADHVSTSLIEKEAGMEA